MNSSIARPVLPGEDWISSTVAEKSLWYWGGFHSTWDGRVKVKWWGKREGVVHRSRLLCLHQIASCLYIVSPSLDMQPVREASYTKLEGHDKRVLRGAVTEEWLHLTCNFQTTHSAVCLSNSLWSSWRWRWIDWAVRVLVQQLWIELNCTCQLCRDACKWQVGLYNAFYLTCCLSTL